jgi:hypothetical protein
MKRGCHLPVFYCCGCVNGLLAEAREIDVELSCVAAAVPQEPGCVPKSSMDLVLLSVLFVCVVLSRLSQAQRLYSDTT